MIVDKFANRLNWIVLAGLITVLLSTLAASNTACADDNQGERLFKNNCANCHTGGKNSIDPKKPVIGSKKLATKATFKSLLEVKTGLMPPFKAIAAKDEALSALYDYVKTLK